MKKALIMAVLCTVLISFSKVNASNEMSVKVNGETILFTDAKPLYNSNGNILVPIRFIAEKLGSSIIWDDNSKKVTIRQKNNQSQLLIGSNLFIKNGKTFYTDLSSELIANRTYTSLNLLNSLFECQSNYELDKNIVDIETKEFEFIDGYTFPKNSKVSINHSNIVRNLELTMSYNIKTDINSMKFIYSDIVRILSSKFGKAVSNDVITTIKQKTSVNIGFSDKNITTRTQIISLRGRKGEETISIVVSFPTIELLQSTKLEKPPFTYFSINNTAKLGDLPHYLEKNIEQTNCPYENWFSQFKMNLSSTNLLEDFSSLVPPLYNNKHLVNIFQDTKYNFLVYGDDIDSARYLVCCSKNFKSYLHAYDFDNYSYSPQYIKQNYFSLQQSLLYAKEENGILYVSHANISSKSDSKNMNAYITAIRLSDNKILFRSEPLVANSVNFAVTAQYIISGYGFAGEENSLCFLDKSSGKLIKKLPVDGLPQYIYAKDNCVYVKTTTEELLLEKE